MVSLGLLHTVELVEIPLSIGGIDFYERKKLVLIIVVSEDKYPTGPFIFLVRSYEP
jgi:hypothetical protein